MKIKILNCIGVGIAIVSIGSLFTNSSKPASKYVKTK